MENDNAFETGCTLLGGKEVCTYWRSKNGKIMNIKGMYTQALECIIIKLGDQPKEQLGGRGNSHISLDKMLYIFPPGEPFG